MSATYTSIFCGAGGDITGFTEAGYQLVAGANHWDRAVETVSANYPDAEFLCTDINHYDMRRLPHSEVLFAGVLCTEGSPAGGRRKALQPEFDLEFQGHVPSAAFERTRACAWDVVRAAEIHRYKAVVVENVCEFAWHWELFDHWTKAMCALRPGYRVQIVSANTAHVYGPGNDPAPQWRDRIFVVFTRTDLRVPTFDLRPPAMCTEHGIVTGRQVFKGRRPGKYGQQYLYACTEPGCRHVVEPYVLPAIDAIDTDDIGTLISARKKPLAVNTMARIQWGLDNLVAPLLIKNNGGAGETQYRAQPLTADPMGALTVSPTQAVVNLALIANSGHDDNRTFDPATAPLPARTTKISEGVATLPMVVTSRRHATSEMAGAAPLATLTAAGNHHGLATMVVPRRDHGRARDAHQEPTPTITTAGNLDLVLVKNNGGNARPEHLSRLASTGPMATLTVRDTTALVIPYRRGRAKTAGEPLHTLATRESAGLAHGALRALECFYRMLKPREHLRGQRFRDSYSVSGNKGEQTMQAGNAVSVNVSHWIALCLAEVLA